MYIHSVSGPELSDGANWEEWWLPNAKFLEFDTEHDDEYFSYIISPDCSSCDVANNIEENPISFFNTDTFGDRTGYHMTGTLFGCQMPNKALKDCSWDYDSYECTLCITGTSQKVTLGLLHCALFDMPFTVDHTEHALSLHHTA